MRMCETASYQDVHQRREMVYKTPPNPVRLRCLQLRFSCGPGAGRANNFSFVLVGESGRGGGGAVLESVSIRVSCLTIGGLKILTTVQRIIYFCTTWAQTLGLAHLPTPKATCIPHQVGRSHL